jgi:integrase
MGINTGRRCGDLVKLRVRDVVDFSTGQIVDKISIFKEQKTKKLFKYMYLNSASKEAIQLYLNNKYNNFPSLANANDFLFSSQVQSRTDAVNPNAIGHIGVRPAWAILNKAANELGIDQSKCNIGTHSLRKTLGYQKYKLGCQRGDTSVLTTLMVAFNHNSPDVTTRYIGITDDEMKEFMMNDVL